MVVHKFSKFAPIREIKLEDIQNYQRRSYKEFILFLGKNYGFSKIFSTQEVSKKRGISSNSGYIRRLCRNMLVNGLLDVHKVKFKNQKKEIICYSLNEKGMMVYNNLVVMFHENSVPPEKLNIKINRDEIKIYMKLKRYVS